MRDTGFARWCDDAMNHIAENYAGVILMGLFAGIALLILGLVAAVLFRGGGPTCAPGSRLGEMTSREMRTVMIGKVATLQPVDVTVRICVSE